VQERTRGEARTAESASKSNKYLEYEYCWEEMYPSLPHIYDRRLRRLRNSSRVFIDVLHPLVCRILLGMLLGFPKEKDPVPLSKYDWQHLCDAFDLLGKLTVLLLPMTQKYVLIACCRCVNHRTRSLVRWGSCPAFDSMVLFSNLELQQIQ
jgi:hypothetical protein